MYINPIFFGYEKNLPHHAVLLFFCYWDFSWPKGVLLTCVLPKPHSKERIKLPNMGYFFKPSLLNHSHL